jgi:AcrR family transcriptional regulator
MTRGAFYNNFADKEELFLAVAEKLWEPGAPTVREGASLTELMSTIGRSVAAAAERRRPLAVGALSFQAYALKNETMRRRLVEANGGIYKWAEKHLLTHIQAERLPMPASQFVRAVHALTEGFLALKFLTPELIDDETIVAAFEAMAGER